MTTKSDQTPLSLINKSRTLSSSSSSVQKGKSTTRGSSNETLSVIRKQRQSRRRTKTSSSRLRSQQMHRGAGRDDPQMVVIVIIAFGIFWFVGFFVMIIAKLPDINKQHELNELAEEIEHSAHGPALLFQKFRKKIFNKGIDNNSKINNHQFSLPIVKGKHNSNDNSILPEYPIISRTSNDGNHNLISKEALDMCHRTLWHTLETTTIVLPNDETFIHTGDIDDLWLRDSAAQIHPLLVPFFSNSDNVIRQHSKEQRNQLGIPSSPSNNMLSLVQLDPKLRRIVSGLIRRTAMYIRHDPYANAFRIDDTYVFSEAQKRMGRHDLISTWNYELDSACYYIRMIYYYYRSFPDDTMLRTDTKIRDAVSIMIDLWISEQKHEDDAYPTGELFDCLNCNKPYRYPGLPRSGKGSPTNSSSGLTWTGFRPSDDECKYGFLIPANMFAVVALRYVMQMSPVLGWDNDTSNPSGIISAKAAKLANEIENGINEHGIVDHPVHGKIYAYEVDGLGNYLLMDDANVPSLMSVPYLGYANGDSSIYENTRKFILSNDNPTYKEGYIEKAGLYVKGYGSPHMRDRIKDNIWPMSLAMQGLTTSNTTEKTLLIDMLVKTTGGKGWMHESFDVTNPNSFTRSWFCWADSLFAELVMSITDECPNPSINDAIHKYHIMEWRDDIDKQKEVSGGIFQAT